MKIFIPLLTVLFIGLKLTHHIDWPWVWVVSPMWIGISLAFVIGMILSFIDYK